MNILIVFRQVSSKLLSVSHENFGKFSRPLVPERGKSFRVDLFSFSLPKFGNYSLGAENKCCAYFLSARRSSSPSTTRVIRSASDRRSARQGRTDDPGSCVQTSCAECASTLCEYRIQNFRSRNTDGIARHVCCGLLGCTVRVDFRRLAWKLVLDGTKLEEGDEILVSWGEFWPPYQRACAQQNM